MPMMSSVSRRGSSVVVRFAEADGLRTTGGRGPLAFSLAGDDGVFHWASAVIEDDAVVVSCEAVPDPVEVRYAWAWNPEVNLVNGGGKPAAPFRARLR